MESKLIQEDFVQLDLEFDELQTLFENTDNNSKKYNICLRGLKEGVVGRNLAEYLVDLFTNCLGVYSELPVQIVSAFWVGTLKKNQ